MNQYQQQRHVLGSQADITIIASDQSKADAVFGALWERMEQFGAQFSRFDAASELSKFNARAGEWTAITPEFHDLLHACKHYSLLTAGVFNPFVLPALQRAGYTGSWPDLQASGDPTVDFRERQIAEAERIELSGDAARIPVTSALDLGGIGKGYALDLLATLFTLHSIDSYCASLGGDVICRGLDTAGNPWRIGIADPLGNKRVVGVISNHGGTPLVVASSTVVKRRGSEWHHLIDPRTGEPSTSDILMATVVTTSGCAADVFAKTLIIDPYADIPLADEQDAISAAFLQLKDGTHIVHQVSETITTSA